MSGYTPSVKFEHDFRGDIISYDLTRLKRKELMRLTEKMLKVEGDGTIEAAKVMDLMIDMLPDHISNFVGPKGADGKSIPLEIVLEDAFFMKLATAMGSNLMEASKMEDSVKKEETLDAPLQLQSKE